MGLHASIYKDQGRSCSNGGVSERCDEVTIVNIDGPFEPTDECPAVMLVDGNIAGTAKVVQAVEVSGPGAAIEYHGKWAPMAVDGDKTVGPMMGGCYVGTPDSRLAEAVERITGERFHAAVPLHDRFETPAQYEALTR